MEAAERRKFVIYVAGPYRARTWGGVKKNVADAMDVAAELLRAGYTVICPHSMTHSFEMYGLEDAVFLESDLELVRRCDAIVMLPDWHCSRGAWAEHNLATGLGKHITYWKGELSNTLAHLDFALEGFYSDDE